MIQGVPRWMQWLGFVFLIGTVGGWLIAYLGWLLLVGALLWLIVIALPLVRARGLPASLQTVLSQMGQVAASVGSGVSALRAPSGAATPVLPKPALNTLTPPKAFDAGMKAIEALHGVEEVRGALQDIFAMYRPVPSSTGRSSSVRAGTLILLQGPRGTGKMTVARNLALMLYGRGLTKKQDPVVISSYEGKAINQADLYSEFRKLGAASVDGVIVFRDAEWLASDTYAAIGSALSQVAEDHPHRLTVILIGKGGLATRIQHSAELRPAWSNRFGTRAVNFPTLPSAATAAILTELANAQKLRFDAGAKEALATFIDRVRNTETFENAVTVHALFENARDVAVVRASTRSQSPTEITLADAEAAIEQFHH